SDSVALSVFDVDGMPVVGQRATWSSDNTAVATVDGSDSGATIMAVAEGSTIVRVTVGDVTQTMNVDVFASQFEIDVRYLGSPTASQRAAFDGAAAFWREIIVGDLSDIDATGTNVIPSSSNCIVSQTPEVNEIIDDVIIFAEFVDIDGPGGTLGQAGPCIIRSSNALSIMGGMQFDTADLANLEAGGGLTATIRHEMGHVLGIGVLWDHPNFNFLVNPSDTAFGGSLGADTHFTGPLTIAAFDQAGGTAYTGAKVPVENDQDTYGSGSLDGHWREGIFDNELMTPSLNSGSNPTSLVTVQSLADLGYEVNTASAEGYSLPPGTLLTVEGALRAPLRFVDDVVRVPLVVMDEDGRVVGLVNR
ncbi:MAG: leishmanolysin-related zinc metalloendopeptidase, partial [Longimicrobiales bacterium]